MHMKVESAGQEFPKGNLMQGKTGVIMGVANEKSIAWGIAQALSAQGARVAFTYQSEVLQKRVEPLAQTLEGSACFECDVTNDAALDLCFNKIAEHFGQIDFVVHSIGFSDKNELRGRYLETSRANFLNTMDISCYSLTAVAKRAEKLMPNGGSILTLSYYGAEKAFPNYNVMGVAKAALEASVKYLANDLGQNNIRVNAISAGTIRTLAASGIGDFKGMQRLSELVSPLRRNTTLEDVGGAAVYLLSALGAGTTGEVLHVDCGYNILGMAAVSQSSQNEA